jgi:hypothetical protein
MNLTSQLVIDFWHDITARYGATVVDKQDSATMNLVAGFLDTIGVQDRTAFMQQFVTTLFDRVYIPFDLGVDGGAAGWSLWSQVMVAAHEMCHVRQFHQAPASFVTGYLFNQSTRTTLEAEAYGSDLELSWWRGHAFSPEQMANNLQYYGLGPEHVAYAAQYLAVLDDTLRQQGSVSPTAKWTIDWLVAHGVP